MLNLHRGFHSNTVYLNVKLVVKCKQWFFGSKIIFFIKPRKSFLDIPLSKVSGLWKILFMQIPIVLSTGMLVNRESIPKLSVSRSLSWVQVLSTNMVKLIIGASVAKTWTCTVAIDFWEVYALYLIKKCLWLWTNSL